MEANYKDFRKGSAKQEKTCDCVHTMHACQVIGSTARPNPDCKKCHGTGIVFDSV